VPHRIRTRRCKQCKTELNKWIVRLMHAHKKQNRKEITASTHKCVPLQQLKKKPPPRLHRRRIQLKKKGKTEEFFLPVPTSLSLHSS
jgi:hypothetical protein